MCYGSPKAPVQLVVQENPRTHAEESAFCHLFCWCNLTTLHLYSESINQPIFQKISFWFFFHLFLICQDHCTPLLSPSAVSKFYDLGRFSKYSLFRPGHWVLNATSQRTDLKKIKIISLSTLTTGYQLISEHSENVFCIQLTVVSARPSFHNMQDSIKSYSPKNICFSSLHSAHNSHVWLILHMTYSLKIQVGY